MDQRVGSASDDILDVPVPGGYGLTTQDRQTVDFANSIKGWGSDLDPAVRPGVPRDKAPEIGVESLYADMPQQVPHVRIHKSTEHARLTPVFGTSCPPKGVSGKLRDIAYTYSEGKLQRWLTLLLADRVDMIEGLISDFVSLRPPNIVKEMGLKSAWKYNRNGVIKKAAVTALCVGAIVVYRQSRKRRRREFA